MTALWKLEEINKRAGGGEVLSFGARFGLVMHGGDTEVSVVLFCGLESDPVLFVCADITKSQ